MHFYSSLSHVVTDCQAIDIAQCYSNRISTDKYNNVIPSRWRISRSYLHRCGASDHNGCWFLSALVSRIRQSRGLGSTANKVSNFSKWIFAWVVLQKCADHTGTCRQFRRRRGSTPSPIQHVVFQTTTLGRFWGHHLGLTCLGQASCLDKLLLPFVCWLMTIWQ